MITTAALTRSRVATLLLLPPHSPPPSLLIAHARNVRRAARTRIARDDAAAADGRDWSAARVEVSVNGGADCQWSGGASVDDTYSAAARTASAADAAGNGTAPMFVGATYFDLSPPVLKKRAKRSERSGTGGRLSSKTGTRL